MLIPLQRQDAFHPRFDDKINKDIHNLFFRFQLCRIGSADHAIDNFQAIELKTQERCGGAAASNDHEAGQVEIKNQIAFEKEAGEENKNAEGKPDNVFSLHRWGLFSEDFQGWLPLLAATLWTK